MRSRRCDNHLRYTTDMRYDSIAYRTFNNINIITFIVHHDDDDSDSDSSSNSHCMRCTKVVNSFGQIAVDQLPKCSILVLSHLVHSMNIFPEIQKYLFFKFYHIISFHMHLRLLCVSKIKDTSSHVHRERAWNHDLCISFALPSPSVQSVHVHAAVVHVFWVCPLVVHIQMTVDIGTVLYNKQKWTVLYYNLYMYSKANPAILFLWESKKKSPSHKLLKNLVALSVWWLDTSPNAITYLILVPV